RVSSTRSSGWEVNSKDMALSKRRPGSPISMSDLRLLEQRAYSGRPVLSADELRSVTQGGYSDQPDWAVNMPPPPETSTTLKSGAGNQVDPNALYNYLRNKFAQSKLAGYVPPDGKRWGITTGSAAEWAALGLAVAKQESDLNTRSYNAADPGGSAGLFQFGQGQTQFTKGGNQFDPQESASAFVRAAEHYVGGKGSVANLGETFGSIRRPNEAGQ